MTFDKLRNIFLLSIPLFILHGMEEYITGFYKVDDILFGHITPNIAQPAFAIFQVLWWILLVVIYKLSKKKWGFKLTLFAGLIYIFELHHLIHALFIEKSYYPGVLTATIFPIFAFLFWKQVFSRRNYGRS